jgi:hypothetical protein
MADDNELPPIAPPVIPVVQADEGLAAWANLVHDHLAAQSGVEMTGKAGGTVHFKFRGQTFAVHVHRVS